MSFTTYTFIAFLGVMLLAYFLSYGKRQWITLLVGSYIFYAFAGLDCLAFILVTTLSSYAVSRLLGRAIATEKAFLDANRETLDKAQRKEYKAKAKKKRFGILLCGLFFNFGILAVLKYSAFAVRNVNSIIGLFGADGFNVPSLLLPLGISFYTFQTMGYLIDVYRGRVEPERNIAKLALFVSFFPQLVQGPISLYGELAPELYAPHRFDFKKFSFGMQRVLWGYFKKLVIADRVLIAMNTLLDKPEQYGGAYVLLLIVLYSVQIYADFTGGIDITIGIAESMGIKLAENFDRPFSSRSTKEYWRRWHITMGRWFREYIFVPIATVKPMLKLNNFCKKRMGVKSASKVVAYTASIVTWFVTGIWHGAAWNFIVWGLLNCLIIMVSESLEPLYKKFHARFPKLSESRFYGGFCAVRTFFLMGLIRSLDCYRNVATTFKMWGSILTFKGIGEIFNGGILNLGLGITDIVIILCGVVIMYAVSKASAKGSVREWMYERPVISSCLTCALLICVIMIGNYGIGYDASQFIYDQF